LSISKKSISKVAVLGAGSWGTALAHHLAAHSGLESVVIWGRDRKTISAIDEQKENPRYFPGIKLASGLQATTELESAVSGAELVLLSVPSSAIRETAQAAKKFLSPNAVLLNTAKGLEKATLKRPSEVLSEVCPEYKDKIAGLSGPSFARELIENRPTAVVIAAQDKTLAKGLAGIFNCGLLRVYSSEDLLGLELGGAFKNVIALAVGISDGKEFGLNARAALITRGLAEMSRLIVALGGRPETVNGLSVLGDLFLTCTGDLSRNRQVGLRLGKGEKIPEILADLGQVSEGVHAAPRVLELAKKLGVEVPITEQVVGVLEDQKTVEEAVSALFSRNTGQE